jgi:hypothetical protein
MLAEARCKSWGRKIPGEEWEGARLFGVQRRRGNSRRELQRTQPGDEEARRLKTDWKGGGKGREEKVKRAGIGGWREAELVFAGQYAERVAEKDDWW